MYVCVLGWHSSAGGGRGEREGESEQGLAGGEEVVQRLRGGIQQTSGEWVGGASWRKRKGRFNFVTRCYSVSPGVILSCSLARCYLA